jgi:type II restriction/modification system DNA methylase subunit YeeA
VNGQDITARQSDTWVIDFGGNRSEQDSAMYEEPFGYAEKHVKPTREGNRDPRAGSMWWLHKRSNDDLRAALAPLKRYIATSRVAKYRLFVWLDVSALPDSRLFAIAREDEATFGVLSSRFHEVWALANASMHGDGDEGGRPTYNAKSCFETFPFPATLLTQVDISDAAQKLNELRENWLNPPEWTDWVRTPDEEKAGYPARPVAKPGHEVDLKKRTLTNLYNARPAWLDNAHKTLDAAVAKAYGWNDYSPEVPDDEILRRLLVLNLER